MVHRGEIVEKAIRRSGYSLTTIAKALELSRITLYERFKNADLSLDFINEVGKIIHYDFTVELPALKKDADFSDNHPIARIEAKYTQLLEEYNRLLELMLRWTNEYEAIHIRRKLMKLIEQGADEKNSP